MPAVQVRRDHSDVFHGGALRRGAEPAQQRRALFVEFILRHDLLVAEGRAQLQWHARREVPHAFKIRMAIMRALRPVRPAQRRPRRPPS